MRRCRVPALPARTRGPGGLRGAQAPSAPGDRCARVGDPRPEAADRAADRARAAWPDVHAFTDVPTLVRDAGLDAAIVLTPAPTHGSITQACLGAGVTVYSERPIAASVAEADRLIETAKARDLLLAAYESIDDGASHELRTTI